MTRVYIDFETRSRVDLKKHGLSRYASDESTRVLCMGYAIDDGPVKLWRPGEVFPAAIFEADEISAWNAQFEIAIWTEVCTRLYGWPKAPPLKQWHCTMALAQSFGLPGALGDAGAALKLAQQKDHRGAQLIRICCIPNKKTGGFEATGTDLRDLFEYCKQDVESERAIHRALPLSHLSESEHLYWRHQMIQNRRGFAVDIELASKIYAEANVEKKALETRGKAIMRGIAPSQRGKVLGWLKENGFEDENLRKLTLETALKTLPPGPMREAIEIRLQASKTSIAKYQKMLDLVHQGRIFYAMTFHGASTGRVTHKGFQPGNLPRGSIQKSEDWLIEHQEVLFDRERLEQFYPPMEVYSSLVRSCITHHYGKLMAGDYAQIEARMLAYLAGQEDLLQLFRDGVDVYKHMASEIFGVPVDEITDDQRFVGKAAVLGAGYGIGFESFITYCRDSGGSISEEDAKRAIPAYREANYKIVAFWYAIMDAAKNAVRNPGCVYRVGKVAYKVSGGWLICLLPSGRKLWYKNPHIVPERVERIEKLKVLVNGVETTIEEKSYYWRDSLRAEGMHRISGKWTIVKLWHGTLVENIVQAACRDIMVDASLRLEKANMPVVLSVHDELISDVEKDASLDEFKAIMVKCPDWCPGLPIKVGAWEHERYGKR